MGLKLITVFLLIINIFVVITLYIYFTKDFTLKRTVLSNEIPIGAVTMDINCDKKKDYVIGSSQDETYTLIVVLSAFTDKPIVIEYPIRMDKLKFNNGYCASNIDIKKEYVSQSIISKLELNVTEAESLTQCGNIRLSHHHCTTYHIYWRNKYSILGSWTN